MSPRLRAFADSNVLFSAVRKTPNNFDLYWDIPGVDILTSQYSIGEVSRHLTTPEQRARLWRLIYRSHLVPDGEGIELPPTISLPVKDIPILQAAIAGRADILITGDTNHFGPYLNQTFGGVLILTPVIFRERFPDHFTSESK